MWVCVREEWGCLPNAGKKEKYLMEEKLKKKKGTRIGTRVAGQVK